MLRNWQATPVARGKGLHVVYRRTQAPQHNPHGGLISRRRVAGRAGRFACSLDSIPYSPYSQFMKPTLRQISKGAEEARQQLPAILAAAVAGRTTIITRHGRAVAAVVPAADARQAKPASLQSLAGTGRGLWGSDSRIAIVRLRDEWNR